MHNEERLDWKDTPLKGNECADLATEIGCRTTRFADMTQTLNALLIAIGEAEANTPDNLDALLRERRAMKSELESLITLSQRRNLCVVYASQNQGEVQVPNLLHMTALYQAQSVATVGCWMYVLDAPVPQTEERFRLNPRVPETPKRDFNVGAAAASGNSRAWSLSEAVTSPLDELFEGRDELFAAKDRPSKNTHLVLDCWPDNCEAARGYIHLPQVVVGLVEQFGGLPRQVKLLTLRRSLEFFRRQLTLPEVQL